jgi:hypothetical protein
MVIRRSITARTKSSADRITGADPWVAAQKSGILQFEDARLIFEPIAA